MNYKIEATPEFVKELKKLSKKYFSLKSEYLKLLELLGENPIQGISLGNDFFKIRISIKSKLSGKSGGARVIIYVEINASNVVLVSIYDKSEQDSITIKELNERIKNFYT
jgi:mRNA-degrading endonuclease RelE of RelBE toxin-antitoxin system